MLVSIYKINLGFEECLEDLKEDKYSIKVLDIDLNKLKRCDKGLLFYQAIDSEQNWIKIINPILQKEKLKDVKYQRYRAIVVLQMKDDIYGISFSGGIHLIKNKYIDYNFGFESMKYFIDNDNVLSYSKTEIGNNIINVDGRSSNNIPIYKISKLGELSALNSISGYNDSIGTISGKYNLKLRISNDFEEIIQALNHISEIILKNEKKLDIKNSLKKVKNKKMIEDLNKRLIKEIQILTEEFLMNGRELRKSNIRKFKVNYDIEKGEDFKYYIFEGINRNNKKFKDIDILYYLESLCNMIDKNKKIDDAEYIFKKIKRDKIVMKLESGDLNQTIYDSIIIEFSLNKQNLKAILINGYWYYLDQDYYNRLHNNIIMNIDRSLCKLPQEKNTMQEIDYNYSLAKSIDGQLLDRKFYNFSSIRDRKNFGGYSKIEPCDVIKYDKSKEKIYMYHIKINNSGSGISHLSTQAMISTDILLDENFSDDYIKFIRDEMVAYIKKEDGMYLPKKELKNKISENVPEKEKFNRNNIIVILGIIDYRALQKPSKYLTILKMRSIDHAIKNITDKGVKVVICPIKGKNN